MDNLFDEINEKYIECYKGIKLHTIIIGNGEPIILLHGFPDFWYGWKKVILGLKDKFKLIVPDLRGYNVSDKPEGEENYKLELLINDIKTLAENLNLGTFYLAGHDWGGMISWIFAEKYPDMVRKLIILNAPHPKVFQEKISKNKTQRRASGYIFQLLKPGGEQALIRNDYQLLKFAVFGTARKKDAFTEDDKKKYFEAWSQPGAILGGVNYYRANRGFEGWTGVINVPTLVIHGMKDNYVTPVVLEGLDNYIKDLQIVRSENASHWVMHDDPELVNSSIRDFIG